MNDTKEAPQSVTIRGFYKGYSVLLTMRDPAVEVKPLLLKAESAIEYMAASKSWKEVWEDKRTPIEKKIDKKVDQESCEHRNTTKKKSSGYNKPENKGRIYEACLDCNKFLNWVD